MRKKGYAFIMTAAMLAGIMTTTGLAQSTDSNNTAVSEQQVPGGDENGERPEMPEGQPPEFDGEMPAMDGNGQPPEGGPGEMNGQGGPGEMNGQGGPGGMPGQGGPGSSADIEYHAANELSGDSEGETFTSETADENSVIVSGETVSMTGAQVTKTGDSDGEDADFYGVNAAVLAKDGADLTVSGTQITTDGTHANGIFSYGEGTVVNVSDTDIVTTGNNSGGLMTTGGAAMNASSVTIDTSGNSSAAIRSDRGGGVVTVTESTAASHGVGSPAIYSTADITVTDSTLEATNSEAVVIEGGNSVTLENVDITGNNASLNGQSTVNTNVLIYQSMSGDASEGNSTFTMTGGKMVSNIGDMFHVTNVTTTINLENVEFTSSDGAFLSAAADSWGNSGSNGGHVTLNLKSQAIEGDIVVDEISSAALSLTEGSSFTGAVDGRGTVSVTLDETSSWKLTGDSSVSEISGNTENIDLNGYTLYVNGEAWQ